MIAVAFGLFGLIIGSFLNVAILRYGKKALTGRSACMSCGHQLHWYDLVPVFSWLSLRGRCRYCRAGISIQYPLVELLTALLFVLIGAANLAPLLTFIALVIAALLILITVYDIRHTLIPDRWVYPLAACALLWSFSVSSSISVFYTSLLGGPIAALPLFFLWGISKGRWMGFGDVKLMLALGWLLGFPGGLIAVYLGFVIGAVISVAILLPLPKIVGLFNRHGITRLEAGHGHFTMKSEVPFGPFLVLGSLIVWFAVLFDISLPAFW